MLISRTAPTSLAMSRSTFYYVVRSPGVPHVRIGTCERVMCPIVICTLSTVDSKGLAVLFAIVAS